MREECEGNASESEPNVQDRKQYQSSERLECATMGAKFGDSGERFSGIGMVITSI